MRLGRTQSWFLSLMILGLVALVVGVAGDTDAANIPKTLVWTAYDVGSAGYAQSASLGHAMATKEGSPHQGASYGYPIVSTYASQDEELVYQQTRMIFELLPDYVEAHPGNAGFALANQRLMWVMPYHDGAIRSTRRRASGPARCSSTTIVS